MVGCVGGVVGVCCGEEVYNVSGGVGGVSWGLGVGEVGDGGVCVGVLWGGKVCGGELVVGSGRRLWAKPMLSVSSRGRGGVTCGILQVRWGGG